MKRFISVLMSVCLMLLCAVASPARVWAEESEPQVIYSLDEYMHDATYWHLRLYENGELSISTTIEGSSSSWPAAPSFMIRFNSADMSLVDINSSSYSISVKKGIERINFGSAGWEEPKFSAHFKLNIYNLINNLTLEIGTYSTYYDDNLFTTPLDSYTIPLDGISTFLSDVHELESQINDLNSEIERLKTELEVSYRNQDRLIEDIDCLYDDIDKLTARRGDINDDGQYTVADVVLLARYVAGTIDSIPYYPPE